MKKVLLFLFVMLAAGIDAQVLKTDFMKGYKPGDKLEKSIYHAKNAPVKLNTWCGVFDTKRSAELTGPSVSSGLVYDGYPEKGNSINLEFPKGIKGISGSVYALTEGKEFRKGIYYLTFLMDIKRTTRNMAELVGLCSGYTGNASMVRVYVKQTEDKKMVLGLGLRKDMLESKSIELNKTHLVVVKVDFTKKNVSLFVDPKISGNEPAPDVVVSETEQNKLSGLIRGVYLRYRSGRVGLVGSFRFADSWSAAVGK